MPSSARLDAFVHTRTRLQAVFARAEQAAAEFRQQGQQRAEARRELIASIKEGDGPLEAEVSSRQGRGCGRRDASR